MLLRGYFCFLCDEDLGLREMRVGNLEGEGEGEGRCLSEWLVSVSA